MLVTKDDVTYVTIDQLTNFTFIQRHKVDLEFIQNHFEFIPCHCIAVMNKNGALIGYSMLRAKLELQHLQYVFYLHLYFILNVCR